jgi:amino acid adenylation domain-containing protein
MSHTSDLLHRLTLDQRAQLERRLIKKACSPLPPAAPATASPKRLSFAQESLWYFDELAPQSPLYNIPQAFRLHGHLDRAALERAFLALVERQSALRTRFLVLDWQPRQSLHEKSFELEFTDWTGLAPEEQDQKVRELLDAEPKHPFRLQEDYLLRARLIRLAEDEHVLTLTLHHIISDFGSLEILHHDLAALYQASLEGHASPLLDLPIQFADWAARQADSGESASLARHIAYWRERLHGKLPVLELPTDRPRFPSRNFQGAHQTTEIPSALASSLRSTGTRESATLYMVLLAAFQTLLYRYSGQEDVLVGSPISQRPQAGAQRVIGFFLNQLVLRGNLAGNPSFRELLRRTRAAVIGAFAHQELPVEKLLESLRLPRPVGSNPLYQVEFQYLPGHWPSPSLSGLIAEPLPVETATSKFDLTLTALENNGGLSLDLEYRTDLFERTTIARWLGNFRVLLASIVADPGQPISRLPLLTDDERECLLVEWNQTRTNYPRQACIHQLFEEQAAARPDATAVVFGKAHLTYAQLNQQANQLARLLHRRGVAPRRPVGLCLERSLDLMVGLLAILKSGGIYLPLDPQNPRPRQQQLLQDSGVSTVITTSAFAGRIPPGPQFILLDQESETLSKESGDNRPSPVGAGDLAYILYTSGTTGQPKGVAVPHLAVVRLVKETNYAKFHPTDVFLQFAPIAFDASTFEIWGALLNGAKLVLYPAPFESLEQFATVLQENEITTLWLTAGLFHDLVDHHLGAFSKVRQLLAGGDVLSVRHVRQVLQELPHCQLINGYGPTENTTFTCCYRFPRDWPGQGSAPIGRPVSNTQVYLLDQNLNPVPIGVVGELYTGGDGLAQGYWESPNLTRTKFIPNPFSTAAGARLYRTGDQARYLADGTLEFLGRRDDQIKVNGFRIHLSEVEAALGGLENIRQSAVLAVGKEGDPKQLAAYVVPKSGRPTSADLRRMALEQLPPYLVPSQFLVLDSLPLTKNGKVDRRQLPPPSGAPDEPTPQRSAPQNAVQEQLVRIWREVFSQQEIGIDDNFFDLGGHSLMATRVISRMNQAFRSNLSLALLFERPTIRALGERISNSPAELGLEPIRRRTVVLEPTAAG